MQNFKQTFSACALAAFALTTLAAGPAHAEFKSATNRTISTSWNGSIASNPLPVNNSGGITLRFNSAQAERVVVTFSAECSVRSGSSSDYLSILIYVDGALVSPLGQDMAFCTSHGNNTETWGTHSVSVWKAVGAGAHTVTVTGLIVGSASAVARIDDLALIVTN
jgi:hypothetical protein